MVMLLMIIAIVIIIMIVIIITIVIVIVTVQYMQIRASCAQRAPCKASALVSFLLILWDWTYDFMTLQTYVKIKYFL